MIWKQRIEHYHQVTGFPRSLWQGEDGVVYGIWVMGNDYRVKSKYYGGYPATYLRRLKALIPDRTRCLHLFSGKVDLQAFPGKTVDINRKLDPDYVDDAQSLETVPLENFDIIPVDPPYSKEDCVHYGTPMVKRNKVMGALRRCRVGTFVCWLDQVLPMYTKAHWRVVARIGIVKSTNHRFRVLTIFRRRASA